MAPEKDTRELSEFLFRACHDLRTPVRAVRTNAELLSKDAEGIPTEDRARCLEFIVQGAARLDAMVDGLARYAVAVQTDPAAFQPTSLDVLFRAVTMRLDKDLKASGATLTSVDLPRVRGNPDRLMEVLECLVRNTLLHGGPGATEIRISAEEAGDGWVITCQDNGVGVDPPYLETIFRPFERLQGKNSKGGPGLGLTVCRAILERHGGKIWAEHTGTGMTVRFTIPKA